jgi:hypothetical protein
MQYGLSALIFLSIGALFFALQQHRARQASVGAPPESISAHAPTGQSIKGFRFTSDQNGHRSIDIRADQFDIKKKKLGMFRLGLANEALLRNAQIDLYGQPQRPAHTTPDESGQDSASLDLAIPGLNESYSFGHGLSAQSLSSLPMQKVAAIRLAPITLRLFAEDDLKISVRANRASIKPQTQEIQFTGNVQWQSSGITVQTDHLVASLTNNTIRIPGRYRVKNAHRTVEGHKLYSDFFLSRIDDTTLTPRTENRLKNPTGREGR